MLLARPKKGLLTLLGAVTLASIIVLLLFGFHIIDDSFIAVENVLCFLPLPQEGILFDHILDTLYMSLISILIVIWKEYHIVRGPPLLC